MNYFKLGTICKTTSGGTPSRRNPAFYGGSIRWVKSGELDKGIIYDTEEKITEEAIQKSSAKIFPKGTLLIALYGATIGKMAFLGVDAATNQAVCGIFKNENADLHYIYHFLFFKRPKLIQQGIGGAQPNISQTILKDLDVPLPPLPTQRAIVAKLEALFSELDKGMEQLKTAQQQLRTYRQAVLKAAFEGRLTGESLNHDLDDEQITGIGQNQSPSKNQMNHSADGLPEGWKWMKLNEIGKWTGGGTPSKQNPEFWQNGDILWVSPKDMKSNRIIDTEDKITENALKNSSAKKIQKGSILFVVRSGIIRRLLPIAIAGTELTTNQDLQSLTLNPEYSSDFVFWYCVGQEGQIRDYCAKDGTTVDNLEVPKLKSYPIPICSLPQQNQIVAEIESRLSVADKMEEAIAKGLQQAEALRQSILKKAFEEELNAFESI